MPKHLEQFDVLRDPPELSDFAIRADRFHLLSIDQVSTGDVEVSRGVRVRVTGRQDIDRRSPTLGLFSLLNCSRHGGRRQPIIEIPLSLLLLHQLSPAIALPLHFALQLALRFVFAAPAFLGRFVLGFFGRVRGEAVNHGDHDRFDGDFWVQLGRRGQEGSQGDEVEIGSEHLRSGGIVVTTIECGRQGAVTRKRRSQLADMPKEGGRSTRT